MYDQSLEQLIDVVVADGVITEQERKVVYKKAASLGIDQDEIEVYLEGRLEQTVKSYSTAKQGNKHGGTRTCPHCGATVPSFAGICPECGHEFTNVAANSVVKDLMDKLDKVTGDDRTVEKIKAEIVTLFPVPNTKEDMIEFATLCMAGLKSASDTSPLYNAWRGKATQIIDKSNELFPNDESVTRVVKNLRKKEKNFFKNHMWIIYISPLVLFYVIITVILTVHSNVQQNYAKEKIEQLNQLPTPTKDNYLDCYRQFNAINWTKPTENNDWDDVYIPFAETQDAYRGILLAAFRSAGVDESSIPQSLKKPIRASRSSGDKSLTLAEEYEEWKTTAKAEIETYAEELDAKLDEIPFPTASNWEECGHMWNKTSWKKVWKPDKKYKDASLCSYGEYSDGLDNDAFKSFVKKKNNIGRQIREAHRQALIEKGASTYEAQDQTSSEFHESEYRFY